LHARAQSDGPPWAGLRGAASVVFSLFAVVAGVPGGHDLFDLVFVIAVSSIVVQGSLLPAVAKKLDMIDATGDVRRTFNDYRDEDGMSFVKLKVCAGHPFAAFALEHHHNKRMFALRHIAQALAGQATVGSHGDLAQRNFGTLFKRRRGHHQQIAFLDHGVAIGQYRCEPPHRCRSAVGAL